MLGAHPETGTTTQGETVEGAVANLKEATALYLAEFPLSATGHPVVTMFTVPEPVLALAGVLRQAKVSPEEFIQALRG